jgi:hypothetical protein
LEHPHRSALENHVHRTPRLGNHGLLNVRIGINSFRKAAFTSRGFPAAIQHRSFLNTYKTGRRSGARTAQKIRVVLKEAALSTAYCACRDCRRDAHREYACLPAEYCEAAAELEPH